MKTSSNPNSPNFMGYGSGKQGEIDPDGEQKKELPNKVNEIKKELKRYLSQMLGLNDFFPKNKKKLKKLKIILKRQKEN